MLNETVNFTKWPQYFHNGCIKVLIRKTNESKLFVSQILILVLNVFNVCLLLISYITNTFNSVKVVKNTC